MAWTLRLTLLAAVVTATSAGCPISGWTQYDNMCYWASDYGQSWFDAGHLCSSFPGADMASVHDVKLDAFIAEDMANGEVTWLGLRRASASAPWVWTDGTTFDYNHWYGGDPDCYQDECCLGINWGNEGDWGGYYCDDEFPVVCQMNAS